MIYRGYEIEASLYFGYFYFKIDAEVASGHGDTIEDCKEQIDNL